MVVDMVVAKNLHHGSYVFDYGSYVFDWVDRAPPPTPRQWHGSGSDSESLSPIIALQRLPCFDTFCMSVDTHICIMCMRKGRAS